MDVVYTRQLYRRNSLIPRNFTIGGPPLQYSVGFLQVKKIAGRDLREGDRTTQRMSETLSHICSPRVRSLAGLAPRREDLVPPPAASLSGSRMRRRAASSCSMLSCCHKGGAARADDAPSPKPMTARHLQPCPPPSPAVIGFGEGFYSNREPRPLTLGLGSTTNCSGLSLAVTSAARAVTCEDTCYG